MVVKHAATDLSPKLLGRFYSFLAGKSTCWSRLHIQKSMTIRPIWKLLDSLFSLPWQHENWADCCMIGSIVASHLTWGSVITVARGHTNGGLSDCGLDGEMHLTITI